MTTLLLSIFVTLVPVRTAPTYHTDLDGGYVVINPFKHPVTVKFWCGLNWRDTKVQVLPGDNRVVITTPQGESPACMMLDGWE